MTTRCATFRATHCNNALRIGQHIAFLTALRIILLFVLALHGNNFAERDLKAMGHDHVGTLHGSVDTEDFYKLPDNTRRALRQKFNLSDELPGLIGLRAINSNPERAMKYMVTSFGSNLKKADNLFIGPPGTFIFSILSTR